MLGTELLVIISSVECALLTAISVNCLLSKYIPYSPHLLVLFWEIRNNALNIHLEHLNILEDGNGFCRRETGFKAFTTLLLFLYWQSAWRKIVSPPEARHKEASSFCGGHSEMPIFPYSNGVR